MTKKWLNRKEELEEAIAQLLDKYTHDTNKGVKQIKVKAGEGYLVTVVNGSF